ncbi:hypothetical protein F8388_015769 [Cannabis sativa]|uniref:Uncharacterized protein n=3 Tax=Cannabis sativa TaxID=3483 RepID=A0A7J6FG54_CANSA|nr:hypothetical protein G4B88_008427 [Cannabis sativa]KAF4369682.1 hypothetical protein F8388_015769 [Cannabis sativa]
MACLVSFTFLLPLSASNVIYKEMHSKNLVLGRVRVSGQPSYRTATKQSDSTSSSITEGISSMNWSLKYHPLIPYRRQWEVIPCHFNVDSCTQTQMIIISGYWVGPNFDDGWGYVEAFVNPVT